MSTARIRFYDDDPLNLQAVRKYYSTGVIDCIHVPPTLLSPGNELKGPDEYFRYVEEHGGWNFTGEDADLAAVIRFLRSHGATTQHAVVQGLTEAAIFDIRAWADSLADPPVPYMQGTRALATPLRGKLFLDWDEVVSQLEGITTPRSMSDTARVGVTPLGYLKLCMGSRSRFVAMKEVVAYLIDVKQMEVHVVTNNGGCKSRDKNAVFSYVAKALHPAIVVNCCLDYRGDKGLCVSSLSLTRMENIRLVTPFGTFKRAYRKMRGGVSESKIRAKYARGLFGLCE